MMCGMLPLCTAVLPDSAPTQEAVSPCPASAHTDAAPLLQRGTHLIFRDRPLQLSCSLLLPADLLQQACLLLHSDSYLALRPQIQPQGLQLCPDLLPRRAVGLCGGLLRPQLRLLQAAAQVIRSGICIAPICSSLLLCRPGVLLQGCDLPLSLLQSCLRGMWTRQAGCYSVSQRCVLLPCTAPEVLDAKGGHLCAASVPAFLMQHHTRHCDELCH